MERRRLGDWRGWRGLVSHQAFFDVKTIWTTSDTFIALRENDQVIFWGNSRIVKELLESGRL